MLFTSIPAPGRVLTGLAAFLLLLGRAQAQGAADVYAITNARIVTGAGKPIEKGTIVLRDGLIVAVGEKADAPADARVLDGTDLTVYPGLIDGISHMGMPAASEYPAGRGNVYELATIRAENDAPALLKTDAAGADTLRRFGFGAALVAPSVGIYAGTSAVISLGNARDTASLVIRAPVAMHLNFDAPDPASGYPSSLMGEIAAARQAMYDAGDAARRVAEYEKDPKGKPRPVVPRALAALRPVLSGEIPLIIHADTGQGILRALKFAREFQIKPVIEGGTEAYKVVPELKAAGAFVLMTLNLPEPPRVAPGDEDPSTLQGLRRRALAPRSASELAKAGVPFALTADGLSADAFGKNIRKVIAAGLSPDQALDALTRVPAAFCGVERQLGTLEKGKIATIVVVENGGFFDEKSKIKYQFVDGKQIDLETPRPAAAIAAASGPGGATAATPPVGRGRPRRPVGGDVGQTPETTPTTIPLPPGITPEMALKFLRENPDQARPFLPAGVTVDQAIKTLEGTIGIVPAAPKTPPAASVAASTSTPAPPPAVGEGPVPPLPPGLPASFVLRGATVWTVGPKGTLRNADVFVRDGKVVAVDPGLKVPAGTTEIDGRGKHITPGMIDCHSHTAIEGGVNEGTNIITAECRIADVINAEDVDIYWQLAGGTTTANLLHGSANAIGGQNAVVKWRWGRKPDELLLVGATPGVKFALGENPKQSNWSNPGREARYPATRLGVEKVIRDSFLRARDYQRKWAAYKDGKTSLPPRRDLQLDALSEVLDGTRYVHCHSYRQDEILAMMRTAEDFGFRVRTFQHVLEGYKIADELAKHGAGASTFSDWWAFKIEAWDAIPYNGALMETRGVVTSFNSDSSELARRLNLEAAKAVKWGGLAPDEAIKLVTINPARQLGIEKSVGSLEPGKDADLVVWSGSPLSSLSVCEKTFVDGTLYFDRAADRSARAALDAEKKRLAAAERAGAPRPAAAPASASAEEKPSLATIVEASAAPAPVAAPAVPAAGPVTAFVGGTIHPVARPMIANGVILTRGGKIMAVGSAETVTVPSDARRVYVTGLHVYPGMVDADSELGLAEIGSIRATNDAREMGDFSPELRAAVGVNPDSELIPVARQNGVLAAVTAPSGGTFSGMGALLDLQGWTWEDLAINKSLGLYVNFPTTGPRRFREVAHLCEETAGDGTFDIDPLRLSDAYVPAGSRDSEALLLGLLPEPQTPQTTRRRAGAAAAAPAGEAEALRPMNAFLDEARRYETAHRAESHVGVAAHDRDPRFEAMLPVLAGAVPLFVRADREKDIRAALAWARRQGLRMVLVGGREADKCAAALVASNVPVVLSPVLEVPARWDLPYDDAYMLPARLAKAGVTFCLATQSGSDVRNLPYQAAMASAFGLDHDEALKAVTLYPARIVGAGDRLGSIEAGKDANLIVTTGDPLEITSVVRAAYISGEPVDLTTKQTRLYDKYRARPRR